MDLPGILATRGFWFFYQLGKDPFEAQDLVMQLVTDDETETHKPVSFRLDCKSPYALEVEVRFDFYSVTLCFVGDKRQQRSQLGWWDEARWHPFALRWDEVEQLLRYWEGHPGVCAFNTTVALLLLARFVGNGVDEASEFATRKERIATAYEELSLFSAAEVGELVESTLLKPSEDDYRWTHDSQLGWVFGGSYPCYSIRNVEHSDGAEGKFPFEDWQRLMAAI